MAAGCWTVPREVAGPKDATVDLSRKALLLFSIRLDHDLMPEPPPVPHGAFIDREYFPIRRPAREPFGPFTHESLVRLAIEPGRHTMRSIIGQGCGDYGGWGIGSFDIPIASDFEVAAGSSVYLGRIEAHTRERRDGLLALGRERYSRSIGGDAGP